jgi:FtsH-binding integral membrane protein
MHLVGNTGYPLIAALAVMMPLTLRLKTNSAALGWFHLAAFALCMLSIFAFYETSQRAVGRRWWRRLCEVPTAVLLGIGMSVSQTRAVFSGLFGKAGEFVRTPKRGDGDGGQGRRYIQMTHGLPGVELAFAAWFALGVAYALSNGMWNAVPYLAQFLVGFAWVGGLSVRDWLQASRERRLVDSIGA